MKFEDDILSGLIDINSRVLDVGCGDGSLLLHLKKNKRVDGRGLEIDQKLVQDYRDRHSRKMSMRRRREKLKAVKIVESDN